MQADGIASGFTLVSTVVIAITTDAPADDLTQVLPMRSHPSPFNPYTPNSRFSSKPDRRQGDRRQSSYGQARSASTLADVQVRRQTIDQHTPTRDVPRNVMEGLVMEEVEVQMQQLPLKEQQVLERSQVMGYALNRLPGLYVTSEKGWQRQWSQGKNKLQCQIKIAVRQGIAAVQQDPLRQSTVLSSHPPDIAEAALSQLRLLLTRRELSWHNIVATIQMLLVKGEMDFPDQRSKRRTDKLENSPTVSKLSSTQSIAESESSAREILETSKVDVERVIDEFFDWNAHPLHQRGY